MCIFWNFRNEKRGSLNAGTHPMITTCTHAYMRMSEGLFEARSLGLILNLRALGRSHAACICINYSECFGAQASLVCYLLGVCNHANHRSGMLHCDRRNTKQHSIETTTIACVVERSSISFLGEPGSPGDTHAGMHTCVCACLSLPNTYFPFIPVRLQADHVFVHASLNATFVSISRPCTCSINAICN